MSDSFVDDLAGDTSDRAARLFNLYVAIENILTSYDDPYDAFSEMVQNALDAVREKYLHRAELQEEDYYAPKINVEVDLANRELAVTDNGIGVKTEHRLAVIRPNQSLKRRLGHKNARGEKGAALVFLQFDHASLRFESKVGGDEWTYSLRGGDEWFKTISQLIDSGREWDQIEKDLPSSPHKWDSTVSDEMRTYPSGTRVTVQFPDLRLSRLFGNRDYAAKRLEYLLRTRTAVGYAAPKDRLGDAEEFLSELKIQISIRFEDGTTASDDVQPGYFYPHQLAEKAGARKTSKVTAPAANSELLYDFFDREYIRDYLPEIWSNPGFVSVIDRLELTGYFCYAYQNQWYESVTEGLLGLPSEPDAVDPEREILRDELLQVNSGFQVAVRSYPTGRRHAFLHRSGAENKSRTFVLLNFSGSYKPDYGRKNLADDVRPLTLELCKRLISFAHDPTRRANLKTGQSTATHGVLGVEQARALLDEERIRFRAGGVWARPGRGTFFDRPAATENEVISEFVHLVRNGALPGFDLFGAQTGGQLDGTFDYYLTKEDRYGYHRDNNPLGVHFSEGRDLEWSNQWLEYKISSDLLVDDLNKQPGASSKKYFTTINLLVCESVDDATDNYEVEPISEENSAERRYFGVTHLLRSPQNIEHIVQVIALQTLRKLLV